MDKSRCHVLDALAAFVLPKLTPEERLVVLALRCVSPEPVFPVEISKAVMEEMVIGTALTQSRHRSFCASLLSTSRGKRAQ